MKTDSRSRYLTFALKIRKLTDALITLVEEGRKSAELDSSIKEVLASLETAGGPTSVKSLKRRGPFAHYENVVTINEVIKAADRTNLIAKLNRIINARTPRETESSAIEAIKFFDALESRALYHHNHPAVLKKAAL